MSNEIKAASPIIDPFAERIVLDTEPEPLEIDLHRTGVVIVDMQNAFLTKGAYWDLRGLDIAPGRAAIKPVKVISNAARVKECKVIYLVTSHHPGDAGIGPDSVHWHKNRSLAMYREHPELRDKLLLPGTWGAEIVRELEPEREDVVVEKSQHSGFFDTNLDTILKRYNLRYLLTMGVATNCCVEATVRDALYRGYFSIVVSDATAARGAESMQEAAIFNIKNLFGWVTTTENVLKALT